MLVPNNLYRTKRNVYYSNIPDSEYSLESEIPRGELILFIERTGSAIKQQFTVLYHGMICYAIFFNTTEQEINKCYFERIP